MTVKQLKKLLRKLPDDMQVLLRHGDDALITACYEQSDVTEVDIDDEESFIAFLIMPCTCNIENAPIEFVENPN